MITDYLSPPDRAARHGAHHRIQTSRNLTLTASQVTAIPVSITGVFPIRAA
jgi:hypothetical protein